jgi:hypothetical protein
MAVGLTHVLSVRLISGNREEDRRAWSRGENRGTREEVMDPRAVSYESWWHGSNFNVNEHQLGNA